MSKMRSDRRSAPRQLRNASYVLHSVLGLRDDESFVVLADDGAISLAQPFFVAAQEITGECVLVLIPPLDRTGAEPPDLAARALKGADAYAALTSAGSKGMTHTAARRAASRAGARGLTLPGMTEEMFLRKAVTADYHMIAGAAERLALRLHGTREVLVRSGGGTELQFDVHGGSWFAETGLCTNRGQFSNLPGGEVSIAPVDAVGELVVDGSISVLGRLSSPLRIEIADRRIVSITGARSQQLIDFLDSHGPDAFNVAEIGIGMNPSAEFCGHVLEDEKVLGTIHVGFGDNSSMGGTTLGRIVAVDVHIDGVVVSDPELLADGEIVSPGSFFEALGKERKEML